MKKRLPPHVWARALKVANGIPVMKKEEVRGRNQPTQSEPVFDEKLLEIEEKLLKSLR